MITTEDALDLLIPPPRVIRTHLARATQHRDKLMRLLQLSEEHERDQQRTKFEENQTATRTQTD